MPMYMREHRSGMYSMTSLFISRMLVDLPMQLSIPLTFGSIVYFMSGLPYAAATFFKYCLTLVLHSLTGASFGYFVGCVAPNKQTAQQMMPLVLLPQMFFAGFMVNLDSVLP